MTQITLTPDQQKVKSTFTQFILNPHQNKLVIAGYAGTGKSTLTRILIEELPKTLKTANLINNTDKYWDIQLTATTNKAAEALSFLVGAPVCTVQSFLGLRVQTDVRTKETHLVPTRATADVFDTILFIDEASYIDHSLLKIINQLTVNCKVIFMGDPAQLTPVKCSTTPVFDQGYNTSELTEVVRQAAGNPIIDLATKFRETVNTGKFFSFTPDNHHIRHIPRDQFEKELLADFSDPDWKTNTSKLLAWTNKTVVKYNHAINDVIKGTPKLSVGDYAVCNKYIRTSRCHLRTDQLVCITSIKPNPELVFGVSGSIVGMDDRYYAFFPDNLEDRNKAYKEARANERWDEAHHISENWIDLRAAYACTINKSQGSTYDRVYIDLDDVKKCRNPNSLARMLYVAVSRARDKVIFTGDLV